MSAEPTSSGEPTGRPVYAFGPFRLDASERHLESNGTEIPLTARACDVLLLLVRSRGRTVTKEEFMDAVWHDAIVEESNLADNISTLRQILGDDARDPRYIRTVPKRGYRFVADVQELTGGPTLIHERHRTHVVVEEDTAPSRRLGGAIALMASGAVIVGAFMFLPRDRPRVEKAPLAIQLPPVVTPVTSFPDQEFSPALSPDGKLLAFAWTGGSREAISLYVKQPDVGDPIRLTTTPGRDGSPAFSPDGRHLAFARRAQRRDDSGLYLIPALGGAERRLLATPEIGGIAWMPNSRAIAYASREHPGDPYAIWLLDVQTLTKHAITSPPAGSYGDYYLTLSRDGTRVAFVRLRDDTGTTADLFIADVAGGTPRRVTFDDRAIDGVAWHPREDVLIYASNRDDRQILWRVPAGGGTPLPLEPVVEEAYEPSVSRDGERLAYTRITSDTNIYRLDLATSAASPLIASTRQDHFPRVSPDGTRIAFESDRSGDDEIWTAAGDGSKAVQVTAAGRAGAARPAWSPDSKRIAFVSRPSGTSEIYVVDASGGRARRLTSRFDATAPSWSRDGRFVNCAMNRDGMWNVWRVPVDGGEPLQITRNGGYESQESADGKTIYFNRYGVNVVGLYRMGLEGGGEEHVLPLIQLASMGDWTVTANGIYYIHRYDEITRPAARPALRFFDFATGRTREIAALPDPGPNPGLSIIDDGRTAIYSRGSNVNHDVMMISHYR